MKRNLKFKICKHLIRNGLLWSLQPPWPGYLVIWLHKVCVPVYACVLICVPMCTSSHVVNDCIKSTKVRTLPGGLTIIQKPWLLVYWWNAKKKAIFLGRGKIYQVYTWGSPSHRCGTRRTENRKQESCDTLSVRAAGIGTVSGRWEGSLEQGTKQRMVMKTAFSWATFDSIQFLLWPGLGQVATSPGNSISSSAQVLRSSFASRAWTALLVNVHWTLNWRLGPYFWCVIINPILELHTHTHTLPPPLCSHGFFF